MQEPSACVTNSLSRFALTRQSAIPTTIVSMWPSRPCPRLPIQRRRDKLELVCDSRQTLRMPHEQVSAGFDVIPHPGHHLLLRLLAEIDHDVAAEHHRIDAG